MQSIDVFQKSKMFNLINKFIYLFNYLLLLLLLLILLLLLFTLAFKPTFMKHPLPRITEAAIGGNITLICDPEGAPQPQLSWLKNGALLQSSMGHYQKLRNGFLLITGVQISDEGKFECKSENMNGEATSSTYLTVKSRPTLASDLCGHLKIYIYLSIYLYLFLFIYLFVVFLFIY